MGNTNPDPGKPVRGHLGDAIAGRLVKHASMSFNKTSANLRVFIVDSPTRCCV